MADKNAQQIVTKKYPDAIYTATPHKKYHPGVWTCMPVIKWLGEDWTDAAIRLNRGMK